MRTCEYCGMELTEQKRFCSIICKNKSQMNGVYKTCIICGKSYYIQKKYENKYNSLFCSNECRSKQKIENICFYCGKKFYVKPSQSSQKYCNRKCMVKSNDEKRKRICAYCGLIFYVDYPSSPNKFCSVKCRKSSTKCVSICEKCGVEFEHAPSVKRKCCSLKCSNSLSRKTDVLVRNTYKRLKEGASISKVELLLKPGLNNLGFVQQYISDYGSIDYVNLKNKIAVFVDGIFWHGRDDCKHWRNTSFVDKINKTKKRDAFQNIKLRESDWTVFRFWEDEVNSNTDGCIEKIVIAMDNR